MQIQYLKKILSEAFEDKNDKIFVNSCDNMHFELIIISSKFNNLTLLKRQKIVYSIINKYIINGDIHAVNIKNYTLNDWNNIQKI